MTNTLINNTSIINNNKIIVIIIIIIIIIINLVRVIKSGKKITVLHCSPEEEKYNSNAVPQMNENYLFDIYNVLTYV